MHCPFCRHPDSRVVDSRTSDDGASIRRRRQCPNCGRRFTTLETTSLSVVKRSGVVEPFSREKVVSGLRKACQGRPVSDDDLALLAQGVEETLRASGQAEIDSYEIGLTILGPLRDLDEVAYLRFASVYQAFNSLEDFEAAITFLRSGHAQDEDMAGADSAQAAGSGASSSDAAQSDAAQSGAARPGAAPSGATPSDTAAPDAGPSGTAASGAASPTVGAGDASSDPAASAASRPA